MSEMQHVATVTTSGPNPVDRARRQLQGQGIQQEQDRVADHSYADRDISPGAGMTDPEAGGREAGE